MKVEKGRLLKVLQCMSLVVPSGKKNGIPVLDNVLIQGGGGVLRVTATDLEQRLSMSLAAEPEFDGEAVDLSVRLKDLKGMVAAVEKEFVSLKEAGGEGEGMPSIPSGEFPAGPPMLADSVRFDVDSRFFSAFNRAGRHASSDASRRILNGVLVERHHLVGTDGKRLFLANSFDFPLGEEAEKAGSVVFPVTRFLLDRAASLSGEWCIEIWEDSVKMVSSDGDIEYSFCLIEGRFPNWRQVVPQTFAYEISFTEKEVGRFMEALKSCRSFTSDTAVYVDLAIARDSIRVSACSKEKGKHAELVKLDAGRSKWKDGAEDECKAYFDPDHLLDAGDGCRDFRMMFNDDYSPFMFTSNGGHDKVVVMPIRKK